MGNESSRLRGLQKVNADGDIVPVNLKEEIARLRVPITEVKGLERTVRSLGRAAPGESVKTRNERIGKGHFGEVLKVNAKWTVFL